jgi:N-acetylglucosamine kinase-like BadF-type ATPase
MTHKEILIAIDGGGTRTRCAAFDRTGKLLARSESGPSNHLSVERRIVRDSLQQAISQCHVEGGEVRLISAGLAGVDYDGTGREDAAAILREAGFERCAIHSDMVIAHLGALAGKPGVLALAGTGSVFLSRTSNDHWSKAGGWGYRIGDEGSAYWIARQALAAASRAFDGRGEPTRLVVAIRDKFRVNRFEEIVALIYDQGMGPLQMAGLAALVHQAAEDGDAVAIAILREAGRELAAGALAVLQRSGLPSDCQVSYQGAVFRGSQIVRDAFCEAMPGASITSPAQEPIFGALLLGWRELGWEPRWP